MSQSKPTPDVFQQIGEIINSSSNETPDSVSEPVEESDASDPASMYPGSDSVIDSASEDADTAPDLEIEMEENKTVETGDTKHIGSAVGSGSEEEGQPEDKDDGADDTGDDTDDDDDDTLKKLETDIHRDILLQYHPEVQQKSYQEILALSKITRDIKGTIVDPLHRTYPFITKYERARVLGVRAKQLNTGSPPFIEVPKDVMDGFIIAKIELQKKKIPYILRRPLPNGQSEYWKLSDLEDIHY
jgi:DNA-directed RNA polymerase I, II, and III subunit RPABC2